MKITASRIRFLVYRGSEHDVLDRYYQTAKEYNADVIVRLTADCPVLDPGVIDRLVNEFIKADVDFAANRLPPPFKRTYPIGLDAEICTFSALEKAWHEAEAKHEREHVMPYFYEEPGRFNILQIDNDVDYGYLRWTVDTEEDLALVRKIFSAFDGRLDFGFSDILEPDQPASGISVDQSSKLMQKNSMMWMTATDLY